MRARRDRWSKAAGAAMVALTVLVVSSVVAQDPPPPPKASAPPQVEKGKEKEKEKEKDAPDAKGKMATKKGGLRLKAPAREPAKAIRRAVDPLAAAQRGEAGVNAPGQPSPPLGTYRYKFKVAVGDSQPLSAIYYPSMMASTAPVVMLVHERERSGKDFEESIDDLKKFTLAETLQKQGYAVMIVELRGHGGNIRRVVPRSEWATMPGDLQIAYLSLVDRHNWGELNVAKLGVVALGEGANLAAAWAAGGGAISSEGRTSDLGALVLLSPMIDAQNQGVRAGPALTSLAPRVPMDLLVGERDAASFELVDSIKTIVRRYRSNQVETFPSALHGQNLLRREPNLTTSIIKFLETTIKAKADEWEGRYLLTPVTYTEIKLIPNPVRGRPSDQKGSVIDGAWIVDRGLWVVGCGSMGVLSW